MDHLCMFYQEKNQPLTSMPMIGKNALDIWKIYMAVKDRGGFQQVSLEDGYVVQRVRTLEFEVFLYIHVYPLSGCLKIVFNHCLCTI